MAAAEELTEEDMKELMRKIEAQEIDLTPLDPQREILAGLEAGRRIRTAPKSRIEDIDVFGINLDADAGDYTKLMREIRDYVHSVESIFLFGKPVTPPVVALDEEQFYIVKLMKEGDPRYVNKLFRVSDMYLLAFQPCGHELSGEPINQPFFRFSDVTLPSWIPSEPLAHNSGHGKKLDTIFGAHWWEHIFSTDIRCTKLNCKRHDATSSQWSILLFAEPPRLLSLQNDVVNVITNGGTADIGCSEEGIHNWKTLSKIGFRYLLRPDFQKSMMLLDKHTKYNLFDAKKKKFVPGEIVGPRGEIRIFKYDHLLIMNIIKAQQDQTLKALGKVIQEQQLPSPSGPWKRSLQQSQQANIPILLAYILLHEQEEFSIEVRKSAGLLLRDSLHDEFLLMVPADRDYIKSQLLSCIWESSDVIRSTAQTVIVKVLEIIHADQWIELIRGLDNCLHSELPEIMKGAMELLNEICLTMPYELEIHVPGLPEAYVTIFMKTWIKLFKSPDRDLRRFAIACVNSCATLRPSLLNMHMDQYLNALVYLYQKNWATEDENGWEERYTAAMSISTIADECINRAHCSLPQVILILIQLLREDTPSVLSLACKTISKYMKYIVQRLNCQDGCNQFDEILRSLLERKTHSDNCVQLDASAALAEIEKEYSTLEGVITELNSDSPFSLLRCLTSIGKAVRPGFSRFIVPVFIECTQLFADEECDKRISSGCLKLLSSVLTQGLPAGIEWSPEIALPAGFRILIEESPLIDTLEQYFEDEDADSEVEQSVVKLLEGLSKVVQDESLAKVRRILAMYGDEEE